MLVARRAMMAAAGAFPAAPSAPTISSSDDYWTDDTGTVATKTVDGFSFSSGDLVLGLISDEGNRTLDVPSTWNDIFGQLDHDGNSSFDFRAFWKVLSAALTTQDFTITGGATAAWDCGVLRIQGAHASAPIHASASNVAQDTDAAVCPTVTTTVDNCLILRIIIIDNNPGAGVDYPAEIAEAGKIVLQHTLVTGGIQMYYSVAAHVKETAGVVGASGVWGDWATQRRSICVTIAIKPPGT